MANPANVEYVECCREVDVVGGRSVFGSHFPPFQKGMEDLAGSEDSERFLFGGKKKYLAGTGWRADRSGIIMKWK